MYNYHLEFILNIPELSLKDFKNSIIEFGKDLEITPLLETGHGGSKDFIIRMNTRDPTIIFDTCSQFGRLKSVKIYEEKT